MPAELLESALADTAGCTHCEHDQLRLQPYPVSKHTKDSN